MRRFSATAFTLSMRSCSSLCKASRALRYSALSFGKRSSLMVVPFLKLDGRINTGFGILCRLGSTRGRPNPRRAFDRKYFRVTDRQLSRALAALAEESAELRAGKKPLHAGRRGSPPGTAGSAATAQGCGLIR